VSDRRLFVSAMTLLLSVMRTAFRRRVLLLLGNNKLRIFNFAFRSCDLELPMEQCNNSAISPCW